MTKTDKIIGFIILGFIVIFILGLFFSGNRQESRIVGTGKKIGLLRLEGLILDNEKFCDQLKSFREREDIKAIVVRINSPGGAVAPSQEIYQAIKTCRRKKPIVVSMASVAASGAYYAAIGADSIFANPGTLTGSIGVIMDQPVLVQLMDKIGIDIRTYKTGRYKDTGSPYRYPTPADSAYLLATMNELFMQFVEDVSRERKIDKNDLLKIADGRIFTGLRAQELGLIDRIGTLEEAIYSAARMAGIKGTPGIVFPPESRQSLLRLILKGDTFQEIFKNLLNLQPAIQYRWY